MGYDDSLDVFGVHAVGGIIGAILTGLCTSSAWGGVGLDGSTATQIWIQTKSVLFTIIYTGVLTAIILMVLDAVMGLRVTEEEEVGGLDVNSHNERGYII
jgi:Amt family ammonium transporter